MNSEINMYYIDLYEYLLDKNHLKTYKYLKYCVKTSNTRITLFLEEYSFI